MNEHTDNQPFPECIDKFESLHDRFNAFRETQIQIQVDQVKIQADVSHIKGRIDNGMSSTLATIAKDLTALAPVIAHHSKIVGKIEDIGWAITRWVGVSVILSLIGLSIWAIANGWKP